MTALSRYELEMQAARADYLRSAGREGLALMREVYQRVTGEPYTQTDACGHCQLTLQKTVAGWYFGTKEAPAEPKPAPKKAPAKKGGKK